nr:alpha/beta hydrolase [uncultured Dyadobacter sp.]
MTRFKKYVGYFLPGLPAVLLASLIVEQCIQFYFDGKRPGPNGFVTVDGRSVHFVKKGSGGPTVVFQSGLGGDHKIWEQVQDSLSGFTTTISYDRSGLLWSEGTDELKTMENISAELAGLLEKTHCPKPYIVVGHSLAGITLRKFIHQNRADVAGAVFVDVSHPDQVRKSPEDLKKYLQVPPKWLVGMAVETGILRLVHTFKPFISDLPAGHWMNRHIRDYFYRMYGTVLKEAVEDDPMFDQAARINHFGDMPLVVVTGAYPDGVDFLADDPALAAIYLELHRNGQRDLLNLSTRSRQVTAPHSAHYVPLTNPQVVIDAVTGLLPVRSVMK